jgi:hypothetical protein
VLSRHSRWLAAPVLGLIVLTGACRRQPPAADSCLATAQASALPQALEHCNAVVRAHPRDPRPLNDRFLLQTLLQNTPAACADIRRAAALLKEQPGPVQDDLRDEVQVRLESCL